MINTKQQVKEIFTPHIPDDNQIAKMAAVRSDLTSTAFYWLDNIKDCEERTTAIRHLEKAMFYANAAIARHGVKE